MLQEELADASVAGWLRNVDRKPWSLEIPYEDAGSVKPMFPDLIVVRRDSEGCLFDILEPHDPSLRDNAAKAAGLARFAERHWHLFDRIQIIRKQRGADESERYMRLDVGNEVVRKRILRVAHTKVVAELSPRREVLGWLDDQRTRDLFVTSVTEAEVRACVAVLPAGERCRGLLAAAERAFGSLFAGRVLPFDSSSAHVYADIFPTRKAIARSRGMAVVTRNVRDFEGAGIELVNPWTVAG